MWPFVSISFTEHDVFRVFHNVEGCDGHISLLFMAENDIPLKGTETICLSVHHLRSLESSPPWDYCEQ